MATRPKAYYTVYQGECEREHEGLAGSSLALTLTLARPSSDEQKESSL